MSGTHNEGLAIDRMFARELAKGPLDRAVVDSPELLAKTAHVRKPAETIFELIARTGINGRQIREWTPARILAFVTQAEANNGNDAVFQEMNKPRPMTEGKYSSPGKV